MNKKILFGISGSDIEVQNNIVIKKSKNIQRFQKQIEKQVNFKDNTFLKTPKILSHNCAEDFLECRMEYIEGLDCINFFNLCDKKSLLNFINNIIFFIDLNINNSRYEFISKNVIEEKISKINIDNELKERIFKKIDKNFNSFFLPIGECHGDLTFTNIIFQSNQVYLIDFLDSFLETPFQDIIKLRQETKFLWSIMEHKTKLKLNENYGKIAICYSYMDNIIDLHYKKYDWYVNYYNIFQLINFCRIIPYVEDIALKKYVLKCIDNILEEI